MAWLKYRSMCRGVDTEMAMMGISAEDDPFFIEDFVVLQQEASAAYVEFTDEAIADFVEDMADRRNIPTWRFFRVWAHTHPGNSPHPSGTDHDTLGRVWARAPWAIMLIMARDFSLFAKLRVNCLEGPVPFHLEKELKVEPLGIDALKEDLLIPATQWRNELKTLVKPRVIQVSPHNGSPTLGDFQQYKDMSILNRAEEALNAYMTKKPGEIDFCGITFHYRNNNGLQYRRLPGGKNNMTGELLEDKYVVYDNFYQRLRYYVLVAHMQADLGQESILTKKTKMFPRRHQGVMKLTDDSWVTSRTSLASDFLSRNRYQFSTFIEECVEQHRIEMLIMHLYSDEVCQNGALEWDWSGIEEDFEMTKAEIENLKLRHDGDILAVLVNMYNTDPMIQHTVEEEDSYAIEEEENTSLEEAFTEEELKALSSEAAGEDTEGSFDHFIGFNRNHDHSGFAY